MMKDYHEITTAGMTIHVGTTARIEFEAELKMSRQLGSYGVIDIKLGEQELTIFTKIGREDDDKVVLTQLRRMAEEAAKLADQLTSMANQLDDAMVEA